MNFNYVEVEKSVREKARKCAENAGYEFLDIFKQSNHPDDHYLYIVVGRGGYDNGYCVWLFNSSVNNGDGSLGEGKYDMSFLHMLEDISIRVRDINM